MNRKLRIQSVAVVFIVAWAAAIALFVKSDPWENEGVQSEALADARMLQGEAYAIDGDTLRVGSVHVRLQGVAAPERDQAGGPQATEYMKRLVNGKAVRCELDGTRSYDRVVGICYLNGRDVGEAVISAGLARDCPRYSKGRYATDETVASRQLFFPGYCQPR